MTNNTNWISVKDKLPELHTPVLAIADTGFGKIVHINRLEEVIPLYPGPKETQFGHTVEERINYSNLVSYQQTTHTHLGQFVTHWMPLPEPPELTADKINEAANILSENKLDVTRFVPSENEVVVDREGNIIQDQPTTSGNVLYDFGDGNGPVPAHRHSNGGGWVADTATVKESVYVGKDAVVFGDAWVCGNAKVYDNARVCGNAKVYENAKVCGDAKVFRYAWVSDDAIVSGDAWVCGDAWVYGNAEVFGEAKVYGNARVYGEAKVCGNAEVFGYAKVFEDAWVCRDADGYKGEIK